MVAISRSFVKDNPELVKIILEVNNVGKWAEANPREVAEINIEFFYQSMIVSL